MLRLDCLLVIDCLFDCPYSPISFTVCTIIYLNYLSSLQLQTYRSPIVVITFPIFYKDTCIFTCSLSVLSTVIPICLLFVLHYLTLYLFFALNFIFNKILCFLIFSYSCSCYISKFPVLAAAPDIPLLFY